MRFPSLFAAAAGLPLALAVPSAGSGEVATQAAPAADASTTLSALRREIAARYVLPETGDALVRSLTEAEARGEFAGLAPDTLAAKVTEVMHGVIDDGHLSLRYDPQGAAQLAAEPMDSGGGYEETPAEFARQIVEANAGVHKLELLPGNIRYLDLRGFYWGTPEADQALAAAMAFLRGGDAIIIDLRRNGGGNQDAVAAMASYFLPAGTELVRSEMRGEPVEVTATVAAPFSLAGTPLYVLTSRQSFSAAEEFASHVSAFGFGRLVGETTGGGGFHNVLLAIPGGYVASISIGRATHARTGFQWQNTGVAPAIAVPAEAALLRAQAEAMEEIAAKAPESDRWAAARFAAFYRAQVEPVDPGREVAAYAGTFGERVLAVDAAGRLTSSRNGQPPATLVAVAPDTFVPEASPLQQFRFVSDGGSVVALEVDRADGPPQRAPRG